MMYFEKLFSLGFQNDFLDLMYRWFFFFVALAAYLSLNLIASLIFLLAVIDTATTKRNQQSELTVP